MCFFTVFRRDQRLQRRYTSGHTNETVRKKHGDAFSIAQIDKHDYLIHPSNPDKPKQPQPHSPHQ